MFKQFLQLDLNKPHDKQAYNLRRNELLLKQSSQSLKFNAICYSSEDIMSKISYQIVTLASKHAKTPLTATVTFNYNIHITDIVSLVEKLIGLKMFSLSAFQLGHFEVRNGHISDYNKDSLEDNSKLGEDINEFEEDIESSLKLQKIWKINQYLVYQTLTSSNVKTEMNNNVKRFGKRTNEFYVLEIDGLIRIILIILPRSKQLVLTKEQNQQIQELYVLNKNAHQSSRQNVCFTTPIAQIISNYLEHATLNIFVSSFPQLERDMQEVLKLPLRLGNPQEEEIKHILQSYSRDKWAQLERETQKMRKRLKDLQYSVKAEQDHMQRQVKIYTKTFSKTFSSIDYLKNRNIKNVGQYINSLKREIQQKQHEVNTEEAALKEIHLELIMDEEKHLFYLNKLKKYKENCIKANVTSTTQSVHTPKQDSSYSSKGPVEPTEEELMFFYDPQKEINRYADIRDVEMKTKLSSSTQKINFLRTLEQVRDRLNKAEFNKIQQDFYDLIST